MGLVPALCAGNAGAPLECGRDAQYRMVQGEAAALECASSLASL